MIVSCVAVVLTTPQGLHDHWEVTAEQGSAQASAPCFVPSAGWLVRRAVPCALPAPGDQTGAEQGFSSPAERKEVRFIHGLQ